MGGFGGHPVVAVPVGAGGAGVGLVELFPATGAATIAATDLAAATFSLGSGGTITNRLLDLRGARTVRVMGPFYGTPDAVVAANKVRVRYRTDGDLNAVEGAAGWQTLLTTAGGHTNNAWLVSDPVDVPADARIAACVVQVGFYDGDGAADPTLFGCYLLVT